MPPQSDVGRIGSSSQGQIGAAARSVTTPTFTCTYSTATKREMLVWTMMIWLLLLIIIDVITATSNQLQPTTTILPTRRSFTRSRRASIASSSSILVVGSANVDTILPVHHLLSSGENLTLLPHYEPIVDVPGGKGCNQAIASSKLLGGGVGVSFIGQFGNDESTSSILRNALINNNVDISHSGQSKYYPCGRGYVILVPNTGEVCAIVSGGSNLFGWEGWRCDNNDDNNDNDEHEEKQQHEVIIRNIVKSHKLILLQCEIPSFINLRLANIAHELSIPVILDAGGEDRLIENELLQCCDYFIPNETELSRLVKHYYTKNDDDDEISIQEVQDIQNQIGSSIQLQSLLQSVRMLQRHGASNVLVTLGSHGSILVKNRRKKQQQQQQQQQLVVSPPSSSSLHRRNIIYQPPCPLLSLGMSVVDETGAGDCYRAGFAVALLEYCKLGGRGADNDDDDDVDNDNVLEQCMKFASAAGALSVTKSGAVPSIPTREEVDELLLKWSSFSSLMTKKEVEEELSSMMMVDNGVPRGGSDSIDEDDGFPFLFGSRLNSMKDRTDLLHDMSSSLPLSHPRDYVRRQATIRGLGCVDFNYPQHFEGYWSPEDAKVALDEVGLVAGAVCLRYPTKFARGAMNHPVASMRREAIEITKGAAEAARILGCNEVVVWSAYDGYDYPFQVNYQEKWMQIVNAFRECCDAYPDIKWSLEYKPTDENTRFFTIPSTGTALLLVKEIDRPNMGLTLDMGHMLMAGENPGQSVALVGGQKLFGIQLNDGYTRLAAEDGLMFGSVHPSIALEVMYQLRQINFMGHMYFDTFPQRTDPVAEAEYNIRRVKEFWSAVIKMDSAEIKRITAEHDAIGALELVNRALRRR